MRSSRIPGLVAVVVQIGCGGVDEPTRGEEASEPVPAALWSTCDFEAGADAAYREPSFVPQPAELRVFAIQEGRSSIGTPRVRGEVAVHVDRSVRTVLVLSAYEPTHWVVSAERGLEKLIVDGWHGHTVSAPPGVAVENRSGRAPLAACGYADEGECRAAELVEGAERHTGLALTGLLGCRWATELGLYDDAE